MQLKDAVLTLLMSLVSSYGAPDDWTVSAPFQMSSESNPGVSTLAYINVTRLVDGIYKWERGEVGLYGSGYVGSAKGVLVHVTSSTDPNDHTGCLLPYHSTAPDGSLPDIPWIALIKRGGCSFETKVENAYKSQATGVIVYNDRDANTLDRMKLSSDNGS
ncbi:hypothetical protein Trydic_g17504 [Trypoxylus dichotomus]